MFFEMYDNQAEDLAEIIKVAAIDSDDNKDNDAMSNHSAALRSKVKALKRRNTLQKDQIPTADTLKAINKAVDDDFEKAQ